MSWTKSYRMLMAAEAEKQGQTYDEAHSHVRTKFLLLLDPKLWWRRVRGRA